MPPRRNRAPERRRGRHQNDNRTVTNHGTATGYRYGCRCDPCKEAKRVENAHGYSIRGWNPTPQERARLARRARRAYRERADRQDQALANRRALYEQAAADAEGELADLIAEQRADDRQWFVRSISLDASAWEFRHAEWDDPTGDAALAAAC